MVEKTIKGNPLQRGERLQLMLDADELRALDDFRYAQRMPSRAAAIRELLRRGLADLAPNLNVTSTRSEEYGVINTPKPPTGDGAE